jgi:hypothetical protein
MKKFKKKHTPNTTAGYRNAVCRQATHTVHINYSSTVLQENSTTKKPACNTHTHTTHARTRQSENKRHLKSRALPTLSSQCLVQTSRVVSSEQPAHLYVHICTIQRDQTPKKSGFILGSRSTEVTHPINMKRKMAAVIKAPRDAGDNIPSMANTVITPSHNDK